MLTAPVIMAASTVSANACFTVHYGAITDYNASCGPSVSIPSTINWEDIWWIGDKAFHNKGITSVTLPSTITDIAEYAFHTNNLTSVNIPNGTVGIGPQAFAYNSISSISLPNSLTSIGDGAFEGNCIKGGNAIMNNLAGSSWTLGQYGCGNNPSPTPPVVNPPDNNNPTPTPPPAGQILFPNFRVKDAPAVTNLDDPLLNDIKNRFGTSNNQVTRGEFLRVVIDSAGVDLSNVDTSILSNFKDVNRSNKYAKYVAYAAQNRIVSGYSDSTFRPNASITRDEATKILVQSIGVQVASGNTTFADIEDSNTLGGYVQTAYDNKLVNGVNTRNGQLTYGNRALFAPKKTITKWELYKIVYNIMD